MVSKVYLKEVIINMYQKEGNSTTEIAKRLKLSQPAIFKIMKKNLIPIRSKREAVKLWWKQQKEKGLSE